MVIRKAVPPEHESKLQSLKSLIAQTTGLVIRDEDLPGFRTVTASRIQQNGLAGLGEYRRLLEAGQSRGQSEWRKLISLLTVGESYFFRDSEQFQLLRERILPELMAARKDTRSLSVWSAGCATGEEPYSLAMMIDELLHQREDWDVLILGTDIDEQAIEKATRGTFGAWSFRQVSPEVRGRYFRKRSDGWQIVERIRQMVDFRIGNLLETRSDSVAPAGSVDLILCRNVFIYFDETAIAHAMTTFSRALRDGGYLVTGHGELLGHATSLKGLTTRVFPESVMYRKTSVAPPVRGDASLRERRRPRLFLTNPAPIPMSVPARNSPDVAGPRSSSLRATQSRQIFLQKTSGLPANLLVDKGVGIKPALERLSAAPQAAGVQTAEVLTKHSGDMTPDAVSNLDQLFRRGDYQAVISAGEEVIEGTSRDVDALHLMAQAYANVGMYEKAMEVCERMIALRDNSVRPYLLLAHIAEIVGDRERAKSLLKRIIYLDPKCLAAYVELSGIYDREHDGKRAKLMRRSALELLESVPADSVVEPYHGITAGELIGYLTKKDR